eukprot:TRINITY_DN2459_c0_g1_i2.p1 TRINITY_DN2459_c0_g1~~TRINITY_DN2459_c0_g1_i2.p1  ORF type:complete len:1529 (+),score=433.04 TRINITY_DN2459_c0_g1_i2:304-4587(+)
MAVAVHTRQCSDAVFPARVSLHAALARAVCSDGGRVAADASTLSLGGSLYVIRVEPMLPSWVRVVAIPLVADARAAVDRIAAAEEAWVPAVGVLLLLVLAETGAVAAVVRWLANTLGALTDSAQPGEQSVAEVAVSCVAELADLQDAVHRLAVAVAVSLPDDPQSPSSCDDSLPPYCPSGRSGKTTPSSSSGPSSSKSSGHSPRCLSPHVRARARGSLSIGAGLRACRMCVLAVEAAKTDMAAEDVNVWVGSVLSLVRGGGVLELVGGDRAAVSFAPNDDAVSRAVDAALSFDHGPAGIAVGAVVAGVCGGAARRLRVAHGAAVSCASGLASLGVAVGAHVLAAGQSWSRPGLQVRCVESLSGVGHVYEIRKVGAAADLVAVWRALDAGRLSDAACQLASLAKQSPADAPLRSLLTAVRACSEAGRSGPYSRPAPWLWHRCAPVQARPLQAAKAEARLMKGRCCTYVAVVSPELSSGGLSGRIQRFVEQATAAGGKVEAVLAEQLIARWDGSPAPLCAPTRFVRRWLRTEVVTCGVGFACDSDGCLSGVVPPMGALVLSAARSRAETLAAAALQEGLPALAEGCPAGWRCFLPVCCVHGRRGVQQLRGGLSVLDTPGSAPADGMHTDCVRALREEDYAGAKRALQADIDLREQPSQWSTRLVHALQLAHEHGEFSPAVTHAGLVLSAAASPQLEDTSSGQEHGVDRRRQIRAAVEQAMDQMGASTAKLTDNAGDSTDDSTDDSEITGDGADAVAANRDSTEASLSASRRLLAPAEMLPRDAVWRSLGISFHAAHGGGLRRGLWHRLQTEFLHAPNPDRCAAMLRYWSVAKVVALVYNAVVIPSVVWGTGDTFPAALFALDTLTDSVYWVDIVLRFQATVEVEGVPVRDPAQIRRQYLFGDGGRCRCGWFATDLAACLPWELCLLAVSSDFVMRHRWTRANRLLNLLRFGGLADGIRQTFFPNSHPVKFTILTHVFQLAFILLWIGCLVMGVVFFHVDDPAAGYDTIEDAAFADGGPWYRTLVSFFWALRGFSGYGCPYPQTTLQTVATLVCHVTGIVLFATVIGYMQTLLGLLGSTYQEYVEVVNTLHCYFDYRKVPHKDRREVMAYTRALWHRTRQAMPQQYEFVFDEVPEEIAGQLRFYNNCRVLHGSDVQWQSLLQDELTVKVVSLLQPSFLPPHQELVRRGDQSSGIHFIYRGRAVAAVDGTLVETLQEGAYWGEMAVLYSVPEVCTVVISVPTELFCLPHDSCEALLAEHPCLVQLFVESAARRKAEVRRLAAEDSSAVAAVTGAAMCTDRVRRRFLSLRYGGESTAAASSGSVNPLTREASAAAGAALPPTSGGAAGADNDGAPAPPPHSCPEAGARPQARRPRSFRRRGSFFGAAVRRVSGDATTDALEEEAVAPQPARDGEFTDLFGAPSPTLVPASSP